MSRSRGRGERATQQDRTGAHEAPVPVSKKALNKADAAQSLSMSVDSLERYVLPGVRTVRMGKLVLIPVGELDRWLDENAEGLAG
jgi:hypothetical protein